MAVSVLPPFQGSFCYFPFSFSTTLVIPVKYTLDHSYTTSTTIHSYPVTIEVVPTAKKDSPILVSAYVQLTPTDSKIHPIVEQKFKTLESIKKTHTFSDGYHFLINFSIPTALWKDSCVHESRQRTCCLGLCNQGATCYLNSALQLLYWTPLFRKGVYHLESKSDIPRTLQKLFFDLQTSAHPPTTQNLTKAFGWTSNDVMVQQDTQEFLRVLFDVLEKKMDETLKIFSGSIAHCIECDGFKSETNEEFSDLSVDVDGCKTLNDSFKKYFATEKLSGENKYRTPDGKLKDAVKFTMDFTQNRAIKISSPLQFDKTLDLSKFCDEENVKYEIFGVLIHSGGCYGGHYYAYIRPCPSMDFWIECNDSNVRIAPWKNVYEEGVGIGGTTGYLLAYVRIESVQEIFCNINRSDISGALWEQRSQDWVNWKEEYSSRSKISSSSVVSSSTNYGSTNNVKRIGESYSLHPSKTSKHVQQHDVLQKFNIILSTEFTTTGLDPDSPKHIQLSLPTTTTTKGVIDFITKKYSLENKKVIIFKLGRPVHEIRKSSSYLKSVVNQQPFVVVIDPLNAATNRVMAYIKGEIERSVVFVGKLDEELEKIVDIKPVLFDDSTTIKDLKKVTGFSGDVHALTNLLEKYQKVDDRQVLSSTTHVAKTLFSLNTNYKIISLNSYILPLFVIGKDIVNFYSKKYLGIVVHCNPSPAPFQPIQTPIVDITILKNDTIEILITTLASQIQQPLHHIYLTRLPKASYNSYFSRKVVDFLLNAKIMMY
ncbi:ubiquitinyl hydrolase 1 [Entamoeba marina]